MDEILNYESNTEDDLYNILGCDELSTIDQINAEYKARVLDCHPDKNPDTGAAERFAKIQKAKEILTDPETRYKYDLWKGSGLWMSFDQWMGLRSAVHTSMHWASVKKQPMLEHDTTNIVEVDPTHSHISQQTTETHIYQDHQDIKPSSSSYMSWNLRDKTDFGGIQWQRDPASETLKKFRNYEI